MITCLGLVVTGLMRRGSGREGVEGGGCDGVVGIGVVGEDVVDCWVVEFGGGTVVGRGGDECEEGVEWGRLGWLLVGHVARFTSWISMEGKVVKGSG